MKITIEHESFTASTTSLIVAERLLETIRILQNKPKPQQDLQIPLGKPDVISVPKQDIFNTTDIDDVPKELLKSPTSKFNPDWCEHKIDLRKQKIVRYSNPCSTLHGHNGGKVWQTELWIETNGEIDTCDCEYADLDKLHEELDAIVNQKTVFSPKPKTEKTVNKTEKNKPACSLARLQEVADVFNRGCDNKQVAEILGLSGASVSKYKTDCRKAGLLK